MEREAVFQEAGELPHDEPYEMPAPDIPTRPSSGGGSVDPSCRQITASSRRTISRSLALAQYCQSLGLTKAILQSDPEPALQALARKVASELGWDWRATPVNSTGSNGRVERLHQDLQGGFHSVHTPAAVRHCTSSILPHHAMDAQTYGMGAGQVQYRPQRWANTFPPTRGHELPETLGEVWGNHPMERSPLTTI
eukprot:1794381-Amphidinium_carterae.1